MPQQLDYLGSARITRIIDALQDPRLLPADLVWSSRIPDQPASDEEITARWTGTVKIADIIADDAKGVTYKMGRFNYETVKIPNLKVGVAMNQAAISKYHDLASYYPNGLTTIPAGDKNLQMFNNMEARMLDTVSLGVKQRKEYLHCAMLADGVGFNYNRLGINLSNVSFGMYPDLKVTPATPWNNTSATPITDIQTVRRTARIRYGIDLNRVTLSSQALLYATSTTEFQNQAKNYVGSFLYGAPVAASPNQSDAYLASLLGRILSGVPGSDPNGAAGGPVTIETYDSRYWQEDENGQETSAPYMPITNVVLTDSRSDGNRQIWDWANSIPTESIVASMGGGAGIFGGSIPMQYGPVAYATLPNTALNPPGIVYWGVARGWPRKWKQQSSAVLSVGTFADTVSTALPAIV